MGRVGGPERHLHAARQMRREKCHKSKRFPVLPVLVLGNSLCFFSLLARNSFFPFFSRDVRGSIAIKNPWLFGRFLAFPPPQKKIGKTGFREILPN